MAPKVLYSFEARRNIKRLIERTKPDICHCHSIYHHISPSILGMLSELGVPVVMTLHDLKIACPAYHMFNANGLCEECKGNRLHKVVTNRCMKGSLAVSAVVYLEAVLHRLLRSYEKHVTKFVVPCRFYIDKFVEWGWPRERFIYIPNPADISALTPDFQPGSRMLYFGRLSPEKGLPTLIRASALAQVPLDIVGDGPQAQELQQLTYQIGAPVRFVGHLSGSQLYQSVQQARATVLPAEWYENAPMTILESFALGKPAIGADIGGIPEMIGRRDSTARGALFQSGSVNDLARVLAEFHSLSNAKLVAMGQAGRDFVVNEMSSARYLNNVVDLYDSLTAKT
ncbi:MAG: glycosyltransferase [Pseudomonadota bacterium]